ncbi:unnamed protein product [Ectocarpus sp. 12 AP-2014]
MPVCGIPCSLSLKHQSPEEFGSSRLLHQKPYVLLRACLAFNSLYWLIRSMSVFGNAHWLLYLTHWTFALQTIYYFLALGSAIHLWLNSGRKRRAGWLWSSPELEGVGGGPAIKGRGVGRAGNDSARDRSKEKMEGLGSNGAAAVEAGKGGLQLPKAVGGGGEVAAKRGGDGRGAAAAGGGNGEHIALERWRKLQWGLLIVCADSAIIVTGVYWTFLYNGWTDQLNLQIHLFNALFMAANVFIGGSPFKWQHIGIAYIYGFLYLGFDILYYIFGSVFGYKDSRVIYFFLDWGGAPGRAVTVTLFLLSVGLPLSHGLHVAVAWGRDWVRRMRPGWGWQGTDEEDFERAMEMSGLRDTDVWAPLTGEGFDSEEEEMGGASVFHDYHHATARGPSGNGKRGGASRAVAGLRQQEKKKPDGLGASRGSAAGLYAR